MLTAAASSAVDWLHHRAPGRQDQRDPSDVGGSDQDCQPRGGLHRPPGHHHRLCRQHQLGPVSNQCQVSGSAVPAGLGRAWGRGGRGGSEPLLLLLLVPFPLPSPPSLSCCPGFPRAVASQLVGSWKGLDLLGNRVPKGGLGLCCFHPADLWWVIEEGTPPFPFPFPSPRASSWAIPQRDARLPGCSQPCRGHVLPDSQPLELGMEAKGPCPCCRLHPKEPLSFSSPPLLLFCLAVMPAGAGGVGGGSPSAPSPRWALCVLCCSLRAVSPPPTRRFGVFLSFCSFSALLQFRKR